MIWGFINLNNGMANKSKGFKMKEKFSKYKIDKYNYFIKENMFIGCGMQYITNESLSEVLPLYDKENGLILTADAIIDNREELYKLLNIKKDIKEISDSYLILEAYKKWNKKLVDYIVGDFTFFIYDEKQKEVFIARDHVGSRSLYYTIYNNTLVFSTLIEPILAYSNKLANINEQWIAEYLSINTMASKVKNKMTIYKEINELSPASYIRIKEKKIKVNKYWTPFLKEIKFNNDEEYIKEFLRIFNRCVSDKMRTNKNVGIMLSGGLDSGSVACVALENLNGEKLYGYTSVPKSDYEDKEKIPNFISDESEYIQALKDKYENLELNYLSCEEGNSYDIIPEMLNIIEEPYKFIQNSNWLNEIYKASANNNCNVLLSGSYGNFSISYGIWPTHIKTLIKGLKLREAYNQINIYGKERNVSNKTMKKYILKMMCPYKIRKVISNNKSKVECLSKSIINEQFAKEHNIKYILNKYKYNEYPERFLDLKQMRKLMICDLGLATKGNIETKLSLYHGIISRDPTKDKRIIEFCFNIAGNQYIRGSQDRSLLRRAMKGILPDVIRTNTKFGYQSADWVQRLDKRKNEINIKFKEIENDKVMNKYINIEKFMNIQSTVKDNWNENYWDEFVQLMRAIIIYSFKKNKLRL